MARANPKLIEALRTTALRLREGAPYQWGHAGVCNCGQLAQTVTELDKSTIYKMVQGEWSEHLVDHCPTTGHGLEDVATRMIRFGFEPGELADLEQLGDDRVLRRHPGGKRHLRRNDRDDLVAYLESWADMLEEKLLARMEDEVEPDRRAVAAAEQSGEFGPLPALSDEVPAPRRQASVA